ncbi:MAG: hypothetical protein ACTSVY_12680 [Candidatus Helarchaeota archaeon]
MLLVLSITLIIIGWISTGLTFGIIIYWKRNLILENKWNYIYLGFFGLFLVIDIFITVSGGAPSLVPSCAVYLVASQFRSDEWPSGSKLTEHVKIYIVILSISLLPSLVLIGFSNLFILTAIQPDSYMAFSMGTVTGPLIIPLIIVLGSDPTNRYGTREPERIIGGLFAILGVIIADVIGYYLLFSGLTIILDALAIVLAVVAIIVSVLIFLCIKLGNV